MFPGLTSKLSETVTASAATVVAKTDIIQLTGSTALVNLLPNFGGGFSGVVFLVALDGIVTWTAAGNIAVAGTFTALGTMVVMTYSKRTGKWYPSRVA